MEDKITNRISIILDIKGWTQTRLAEKAEMDEAQLNKIIKGRTPNLRNAFRICRALELPIEKVFEIEQNAA